MAGAASSFCPDSRSTPLGCSPPPHRGPARAVLIPNSRGLTVERCGGARSRPAEIRACGGSSPPWPERIEGPWGPAWQWGTQSSGRGEAGGGSVAAPQSAVDPLSSFLCGGGILGRAAGSGSVKQQGVCASDECPVRLAYQPIVLFSQNKPATSNQPAVLFSQNKSAPATSNQPNEQAGGGSTDGCGSVVSTLPL
jgi:hypothetical protein